MMQNTSQQAPQSSKWKQILQTILRILRNNWPFKLLALLLSIVLWAGLITQDPDLTREKVFDDVKINITGKDALQRNGLIVTSDLNTLRSCGLTFPRCNTPMWAQATSTYVWI